MSRIFDAIKKAQQDRGDPPADQAPAMPPGPQSDRRRNRRWAVDLPVFVYGHSAAQEPFHEEAHTVDVCANGALLILGAHVRAGQKLLLINKSTQGEQECRVAYLGERLAHTTAIAIEFEHENAAFWELPAS